jgi:Na+-translocating ferredoxin:NAD+ oxidoreductase RNF subunit RnfB
MVGVIASSPICTGCSICSEQCPCHAIEMQPDPSRRSARHNRRTTRTTFPRPRLTAGQRRTIIMDKIATLDGNTAVARLLPR